MPIKLYTRGGWLPAHGSFHALEIEVKANFKILQWLTTRLLASPSFHRAVRTVHKKVHEIRHGKDPADMGGTNIDDPHRRDPKKLAQLFVTELRNQFREQFRGGSATKK